MHITGCVQATESARKVSDYAMLRRLFAKSETNSAKIKVLL
jgi:hypothetical protein